MTRRWFSVAAIAAALVIALAAPSVAGGRPLTAEMSGASEVAPGDPDGSGTVSLTLNQGQNEICFHMELENVDDPLRAHIHAAPAGANGPISVFFFDLVIADPIPVTFDGCVGADADLIKDIRQNPENYYVNVHNADFPAGAVRGQLSKW
jgi:hypothetical protein